MHAAFTTSPATQPARVHLLSQAGFASAALPAPLAAFANAQGFRARAGQMVLMPDGEGRISDVLFGLGEARDGLAVAALSARLPEGDYAIAAKPDDWSFSWTAAGWADGAYRFKTYQTATAGPPRLVMPDGEDTSALSREAEAARLCRDMVNTPAEDMGPNAIQAVISDLAENHGARLETIIGDELLAQNYPMVHAVGRAGPVPPRFIELEWGDPCHPQLALVGKGVAFDTGGLNIKTGDYMRLMKKDMGGAAHAIALASLVMGAGLPVHLKLYIPAVENSVAGHAFRPGDVLATRKGLRVEIDNTDAEGRLILCDALARACESEPDLILDFATLTGAARVALGPDLPPFYTDDEEIAASLTNTAQASGEPVWRMPLWRPYKAMLDSSVADISNSGGRMAGSITAAVYLAQFVDTTRWVHFDIWAWREGKYTRPAGGAATGLRASWAYLDSRYGS